LLTFIYQEMIEYPTNRGVTMPKNPEHITISLTSAQIEMLREIEKLTGDDATNVLRSALALYHEQITKNEELKELAKIDAMLDVQ